VIVWLAVCCDNVTGVASSQVKADELYRCGHGQDSSCCWIDECEVDACARPRRSLHVTGHRSSRRPCRCDRCLPL
jgi:hypothetical protein